MLHTSKATLNESQCSATIEVCFGSVHISTVLSVLHYKGYLHRPNGYGSPSTWGNTPLVIHPLSLCPCSVHVTSVVQLMHMLMTRGRIIEADAVDELTLFACYMAAAVHDYGHGGVTNDFLNR